MRNHAVAQRLGISQKTVANYLSAIFVKLHVEDRAQAILLAQQGRFAANPDKPRSQPWSAPSWRMRHEGRRTIRRE